MTSLRDAGGVSTMSGMTAATRKSTASTPLLHINPMLPPSFEARPRREPPHAAPYPPFSALVSASQVTRRLLIAALHQERCSPLQRRGNTLGPGLARRPGQSAVRELQTNSRVTGAECGRQQCCHTGARDATGSARLRICPPSCQPETSRFQNLPCPRKARDRAGT